MYVSIFQIFFRDTVNGGASGARDFQLLFSLEQVFLVVLKGLERGQDAVQRAAAVKAEPARFQHSGIFIFFTNTLQNLNISASIFTVV